VKRPPLECSGLPLHDPADFVRNVKKLIDARLAKLLPATNHYRGTVHRAMRYSALSGGKRIRPALMLAVAQALKGRSRPDEPTVLAACGVEMIHQCSLILDDLPAMDNADARHGGPATHKVYGEGQAILAAIALLNLGYRLLNQSLPSRNGPNPLIAEITDAIGTYGVIGGQVTDLEVQRKPAARSAISYIHEHKTAALFVGAARIAALTAHATPRQLKAITEYARCFGRLYQIQDDLHDFLNNGHALSQRDKGHRPNLLSVCSEPQVRGMVARLHQRALNALRPLGPNARLLSHLLSYLARLEV